MTFDERIQRFININCFLVNRVFTANEWFSLQGTVVFDSEALDKLVIPDGLHLESDYYDDCSEQKCYFLVDDKTGKYEEIIESKAFWKTYAEELKLMRALKEVYSY